MFTGPVQDVAVVPAVRTNLKLVELTLVVQQEEFDGLTFGSKKKRSYIWLLDSCPILITSYL